MLKIPYSRPKFRRARKILHFVAWADYGGTERMVLKLCQACHSFQHIVWFGARGPIINEFSRNGIPVYAAADFDRDTRGARFVRAICNSDLVHLHCLNRMPPVDEIWSKLGVHCIITLHGRTS